MVPKGRQVGEAEWLAWPEPPWFRFAPLVVVVLMMLCSIGCARQVGGGEEDGRRIGRQSESALPDIVLGGPARLSYALGDSYTEVERQKARGIQLAFAAANARSERLGVLARRNLTTRFEDDRCETQRTRNITSELLELPEEQFFGFLASPDGENSRVSFLLANASGKEIPFIGPWSGASFFRNPFKRWVINTLPRGFPSSIYAIIKFLTNVQLLSRIALFYPTPSLFSGTDIRQITTNSLGWLGLRLVSYYELSSFDYEPTRLGEIVSNITAGNPQALIMINDATNMFSLVRALKEHYRRNSEHDLIYMMDGASGLLANTVLTGEDAQNVYQTYSVPLLSDFDFELVRDFWVDRAVHDPDWQNPLEAGALEGYLEGRWIVSVFEGMREPLTRSAFINAVYHTPIRNIGDIVMGPFYQDCNATGCQACCNSGSRKLYLVQFPTNGTLEYVREGKLEWQTCFPQPSDVQYPFKFGQSAALTGIYARYGSGIRDGIQVAFNEINESGLRNNRDAVLISYDDHSVPLNYTAMNFKQLVDLDSVLALVGLTGATPVKIVTDLREELGGDYARVPIIGFTTGSPSLRKKFDRSVVSITPSSFEEIAGALSYFVSTLGYTRIALFHDGTEDGFLTQEGLTKALLLYNRTLYAATDNLASIGVVYGAEVLFVYNPSGDQIAPLSQVFSQSNFLICFLSCRDPDSAILNLTQNVIATQPSPSLAPPYRRQQTSLPLIYFTQALPNPNPDSNWPNSRYDISSLVESYHNALEAASFSGPVTRSYSSLSGYVTGRFMAALISNINGQVTGDSLLQSLYNSGVITIDDLRLGPYYDRCNESSIPCCSMGTRTIYVVQPAIYSDLSPIIDGDVKWRTHHVFPYSQCAFKFEPSSDGESHGGISTVAELVIGLTVGIGGFLLLALLAGLIITAILGRIARRRRRDEWEIDFSEVELGSLLGIGGYGEVYRGRWRGTEVAIKTINTSRKITKKMRANFVAEARIMSRLRHPNVVLFMAAAIKPPTLCIVMEYMSLGSLFDLIHNDLVVELGFPLVMKLAYQAAKGMYFLHSSNVIHRDLKSLNILMDHKWNVKVSDFGLTLFKNSSTKERDSNSHLIVGSIPWMAPELLTYSPEVDHAKCDVYAYGIVLWELMFRKQPYENLTPAQVAVAVLRNDARPFIPPDLRLHPHQETYIALMVRCWHRDPDVRPDFVDIIDQLESLFTSESLALESISNASTQSGDSLSPIHATAELRQRSVAGSTSSVENWNPELGRSDYGEGRMTDPISSIVPERSQDNRSSAVGEEKIANYRPRLLLPSDDVSFVVCDLVRCDQLWEYDSDEAARTIAAYADLVRRLSRNANQKREDKIQSDPGGSIFSNPSLNSGGTFFLAFANARTAAAFTIDLQRAVAVNQNTEMRLMSRVSIHHARNVRLVGDHGHPSYLPSDYAAAIDAVVLCHPGEIICTEPFYQLAIQLSCAFVFARRSDGEGYLIIDYEDPERDEDDEELHASTLYDSEEIPMERLPSKSRHIEMDHLGLNADATNNLREGICSSDRCPWIIDRAQLTLGIEIGEGDYGKVFQGKHEHHGSRPQKEVAVKRLYQKRISEASLLALRKEAAILSRLDHPNVVQLLGISIADSDLLMVMEYQPLGNLRKLLDSSTSLPWSKRLRLLRSAAFGLSFLHSKGIVHRDFKSSNLLVANEDYSELKVSDFGFETLKQENGTQARCGKPAWTAPETMRGRPHTEKSDIYSFGIVMWEVLTRQVPFVGKNMMTIALDVIAGQRPLIPVDCPSDYKRMMTRCWHRKPRKRPSVEELVLFFNSRSEELNL